MSMTKRQMESMFRKATGMDYRGRKARMRRMGDAIVSEWAAVARTEGKMKSTLSPYRAAIQIRKVTDEAVVVQLPGQTLDTGGGDGAKKALFARMIEFGMGPGGIGSEGPYDVRNFLLRGGGFGRKAPKMGPTGPYRNVPFKYGVTAIKKMGLIRAGGQGADATIAAARALTATTVRQGSWQGEKLAAGYTRIVNNPNTNRPHKTDRLAGLRRMEHTTTKGTAAKKQTSRFITFRRATWAGNPWTHSGVQARHLAEKVAGKIDELWERIS